MGMTGVGMKESGDDWGGMTGVGMTGVGMTGGADDWGCR